MIEVSIWMICYNHAQYLHKAINSIMEQEGNFELKLVIGEDCSTDESRSICEFWAKKYPKNIRLLPSKKNLGLHSNFTRTLQACTAEYIAFCEGDDFWTDSHKLQKQLNWLHEHPEYYGVFHNASIIDENDKILEHSYLKQDAPTAYTFEDLLKGPVAPTASILVKREAIFPLPKWFKSIALDWIVELLITSRGLYGYIQENMSAYRMHSSGFWTGKDELQQWLFNYHLLNYLSKLSEFKKQEGFLIQKLMRYENEIRKKAYMFSWEKQYRQAFPLFQSLVKERPLSNLNLLSDMFYVWRKQLFL